MPKSEKVGEVIKAGAAAADISPESLTIGKIWMGGYMPARFALKQADPISVRALALGEKGSGIVIVSIDTCLLSISTAKMIVSLISNKVSVPVENIFVAATHTHSGPDYSWLFGGVPLGYFGQVIKKVVEVSELAWKRRRLTMMYAGVAEHNIGLQRRREKGDKGTEKKVVVLQWRAGGETIATLINLGCHGVVYPKESRVLSSDLPGALCRAADESFGGVSVFVPRIQGDVNPNIPGANTYQQKGNEDELRRLASEGMVSIKEAMGKSVVTKAAPFSVEEFVVKARSDNAVMMALNSFYWTGEFFLNRKETSIKMRKFRIGDVDGISVPGEVLTGLGTELLSEFKEPNLFFSYTGGYQGYMMDRETYDRGGYEPSVSPGPIKIEK